MGSKVFLDANCLLDLTLQRVGFQNAVDIIQLGIDGHLHLFSSPAVLHIVAYYTSQAYTAQHSKLVILTLLNDVRVIDCDHDTAIMALNSRIEDIEDALQYYTALKFGLQYFISSDRKLKKAGIPQLPVFTAAELLEKMEKR